uniref:Uncharacterized protein n=1 Tax=Oncorhynchus kisutch TaxID=8019 RepID=A0A8C7JS35_ONCKI
MIVTMLTAMYMAVRVVEKIGVLFARSDPPLPFLVTHPLPWQVHHVSQKRRSSATAEVSPSNIPILQHHTPNTTSTPHPLTSPLPSNISPTSTQTDHFDFQPVSDTSLSNILD